MQINYTAYFEQLKKYSVSDVENLIENSKQDIVRKDRHAGPLLMVVMNGIDAFGGVLYGFGMGSTERAPKFMKCRMNICSPVADFLYRSVRCGVTHHGMPKLHFAFNVYSDEEWADICCDDAALCIKETEEQILLNVVKFAEQYLEAVKKIEEEEIKDDGNLEIELGKAMNFFRGAYNCIQPCKPKHISFSSSSSKLIQDEEPGESCAADEV